MEKLIVNGNLNLKHLIKVFLRSWKKLAILTSIGFIIGFINAKMSVVTYKSSTMMIAHDEGSKKSSIGNLAALAGFSLSNGIKTGIPPTLYVDIVKSYHFKKELLNKPIFTLPDKPEIKVNYIDYMNIQGDKYQSVLNRLKNYIFSQNETFKEEEKTSQKSKHNYFTKEELKFIDSFESKIEVIFNKKEGYFTVSGTFFTPEGSSTLVKETAKLLQEYLIEFRVKRAQENFDFINTRFNEAKKDLNESQEMLAKFEDENNQLISQKVLLKRKILERDNNHKFSLYTSLLQQKETFAKNVKKDTPLFSVIKDVYLPHEKYSPRSVIIIFKWGVLMFLFGSFNVIYKKLKE